MKYINFLCSSRAGVAQLACHIGFAIAVIVNLIVGIYVPTHYYPGIDKIALPVILFDWVWIGWPSMVFGFVIENSYDLYSKYLVTQR